jgi:hypothetical protein
VLWSARFVLGEQAVVDAWEAAMSFIALVVVCGLVVNDVLDRRHGHS